MNTVFFYGLFMDEKLLKEKGFRPTKPKLAYLEGYHLKIGERATLIKSAGERAYGTIMTLEDEELNKLYSEPSVADYCAEKVMVTTLDNDSIAAVVYNLPVEMLSGQNKQYAKQLANVAKDIGLPKAYVKKIQLLARE